MHPDLAEAIEARLTNVCDLMLPFKRRDVYRWPMRCSYSINEVLPAMVLYHKMCALEDPVVLAELRWAMLAY